MKNIKTNRTLKIADVILILAILFGITILSIKLYGKDQDSRIVVVIGQNYRNSFSIDSNIRIKILGPLGYTTVVVRDGKAWIENSPCREKICMKMGKISRVGQQVICVPNRVLVEIDGKNGSIDAVSR